MSMPGTISKTPRALTKNSTEKQSCFNINNNAGLFCNTLVSE